MNINGVKFPNSLLNALQDGRLVIFAGAGVSMGAPANLPDFPRLARQIAEGTGQAIREREPEDRFLGRLKAAGIDVHRRAAELLQRSGTEPTGLHLDLLRLSTRPENVRIVTTNFDLLFEQAATDLFGATTRVFLAPALPYGQRFQGIVNVHGSVSEPDEMVLTSIRPIWHCQLVREPRQDATLGIDERLWDVRWSWCRRSTESGWQHRKRDGSGR